MKPDFNHHPRKVVIPLAEGLAFNKPGFLAQEKKDGRFTVLEVEGNTIAAETMPNGDVWAFDLLATGGCDVRQAHALGRWEALTKLAPLLAVHAIKIVPSVPSERSGEFLALILAAGGEGICLKHFSATYFQEMTACKRGQIHLCRVTGIGPGQSVAICDANSGQLRGRVPAGGGKADMMRVGEIIRVECETVHESGLFRSAKLCREWQCQR